MDNDYLEVLSFLEAYAGVHYQKPASNSDEFTILKDKAKATLKVLHRICGACASCMSPHLIITNRKIWLRGDRRAVRDYFWVQLKQQEFKNRPISISIFAESRLREEPFFYRLALEYDEKKVNNDAYRAYKRYSELVNTEHLRNANHLRFLVLQNEDNNSWDFCDDPNELQRYISKMNNSVNIRERVQPSYYVSRKNNATNTDRTADEFDHQFHEGLCSLIPYYNHVMDCYNS